MHNLVSLPSGARPMGTGRTFTTSRHTTEGEQQQPSHVRYLQRKNGYVVTKLSCSNIHVQCSHSLFRMLEQIIQTD